MSAAKSTPALPSLCRFGPYELDRTNNQLRKFGVRIKLERKPLQLLIKLLDHAGQVVTRTELQHSLWGEEIFVDFDRGLTVAVTKLRAALNDAVENPKYIETVAGEGYRFIAKAEWIAGTAEPIHPSPTLSDLSVRQPEAHANAWPWGKWRTFAVGAAVLCFGFLVVLISTSVPHRRQRGAVGAQKVMLVVLPFQNLSNDPTQEYFSDGITEELSTQLGNENPGQLGVIGRTSAMTYKHSEHSISQIGKELGVDYVLEGSVRRDGNQFRITAQLVKTSDQAHLWAANYDENFRDILRLETNISAEIARQVGVSIALGQAKGPARPHNPSPEAHEAYLHGRYYWYKRNVEGWKKAEEYFRLATLKDPDYAAAYAGLAECRISKEEAQAAALKSTSLDPNSGEAYAALGWVEMYKYLDSAAAGHSLRKAIELSPNYAMGHYTYAQYLSISHSDVALAEIKEAIRLDPLSPLFNSGLAGQLVVAGQFDDALKQLKVVFDLDPRFALPHGILGDLYTRQGKYREAIAEFQTEAKLGRDVEWGQMGYAHAISGNKKEAFQIISQLETLEKTTGDGSLDLAMIEVGLGHSEQAIGWLQKSYNTHTDDYLLSLQSEWRFDPLRTDPRFQEVVRKMNFPP